MFCVQVELVCLLLEVLLYVHKNCRFIRDGSPGCPPQLSHSSWAVCLTWAQFYICLCGERVCLLIHVYLFFLLVISWTCLSLRLLSFCQCVSTSPFYVCRLDSSSPRVRYQPLHTQLATKLVLMALTPTVHAPTTWRLLRMVGCGMGVGGGGGGADSSNAWF